MSPFATFQPVKINDESLADHGRAGTVRSTPRTEGTGAKAREVIDVQLDANAEHVEPSLVTVPVSSLVAI